MLRYVELGHSAGSYKKMEVIVVEMGHVSLTLK